MMRMLTSVWFWLGVLVGIVVTQLGLRARWPWWVILACLLACGVALTVIRINFFWC